MPRISKLPKDHQDAPKERLKKAGEHATIGADGVRYISNTPLMRLRDRGELSEHPAMNRRLFEAGERYHKDWYLSGIDTLASADLGRQGGSPAPGAGMPASEAQAIRRQSLRKARAAMGPRLSAVVDAVVLEEEADFVAVGRKVGSCQDRKIARTVTRERLVSGLEALLVVYGLSHS